MSVLREVISFEQQRHVEALGERVGGTVAQIETGRMIALAPTLVRTQSQCGLLFIESDGHNLRRVEPMLKLT